MIKIYLDWNVMSQMKNGHHSQLSEILSQKDRFILPYSTSHIGDIFSSFSEDEKQNARINEDLEYITKLTGNRCLSMNKEKVSWEYYDPKNLFQQRIKNKDFLKDFSIDSLTEIFRQDDTTKGIGDIYTSLLKSMPLDKSFIEGLNNPDTSMDKMFPGLKENPTMDGFFKSFGEMYLNLNESEDYKVLRETTQKGLDINRDQIFNSKNPYDIIKEAHENRKIELDKYIKDSYGAEWYNKITNEYIQLDMHGYQEDKVEVKANKRKQTFKNTTEDAFHAAFASTCDFYIVNDKKSHKKTKQVYEKLRTNTFVFKPDEFVKFYDTYLNLKDYGTHLLLAIEIIKKGEYTEEIQNKASVKTYVCPYYLFNFFNKITTVDEEHNYTVIMLHKFAHSDGTITFEEEMEQLIKILHLTLGKDNDGKEELLDNEQLSNSTIRMWNGQGLQIRLQMNDGYVQLYIDIKEKRTIIKRFLSLFVRYGKTV